MRQPRQICIHDARFDSYAYNRTYRFLVSDLNRYPVAERNYATLFFTDADWRSRFGDRDTLGHSLVGRIRSRIAQQAADPSWRSLITTLQQGSAEFRRTWQHQTVTDAQDLVEVIDNPLVGQLWRVRDEPAYPDESEPASVIRQGGAAGDVA